MLKKEARKLFKERRDAITPSQKLKWDDLILIQFQMMQLPFLNCIMSFYSIDENNEVNSFILTDYLHFRNPALQVAYPRMIVAETRMDAVLSLADSGFAENEFGITEPVGNEIIPPDELDLVVVPLLAIDEKGHRVGYGKGYYDRYLKDCRPDCMKVGVSYFEPVDNIDDAAEFDVPLDFCITPERIYVF
jgi:5-formyltetrahydrofolate cyclo-ligase